MFLRTGDVRCCGWRDHHDDQVRLVLAGQAQASHPAARQVIDRWTCPECDVEIQASDSETLAWGIGTHRCSEPLAEMMGNDRMQRFDRLMVMWLIEAYGRPFVLWRPTEGGIATSVVVT